MLDPDTEPGAEHRAELERRWEALERQALFRRLHPSTLRAAWWAWTALRRAKRDLDEDGLGTSVADPPALPWGSRTGVYGVLARTSPTCLERCLVSQRWMSAHGIDTTIVIGVRTQDDGKVAAHAWIDEAADPDEFDEYRVIHRLGPT